MEEDAASFLILEWVEKLFNEKMSSMRDLALFLIDKMYVDNRSGAAQTLLMATAASTPGAETKILSENIISRNKRQGTSLTNLTLLCRRTSRSGNICSH